MAPTGYTLRGGGWGRSNFAFTAFSEVRFYRILGSGVVLMPLIHCVRPLRWEFEVRRRWSWRTMRTAPRLTSKRWSRPPISRIWAGGWSAPEGDRRREAGTRGRCLPVQVRRRLAPRGTRRRLSPRPRVVARGGPWRGLGVRGGAEQGSRLRQGRVVKPDPVALLAGRTEHLEEPWKITQASASSSCLMTQGTPAYGWAPDRNTS